MSSVESLTRLDALTEIAKRWRIKSATIGPRDFDFDRMRWIVRETMGRPHGTPNETAALHLIHAFACVEAVAVRGTERGLPNRAVEQLIDSALALFTSYPHTPERRLRILDRLDEALDAAVWLRDSGQQPANASPERAADVLACFSRWVLARERAQHCRGKVTRAKVPFACALYQPRIDDPYDPEAPTIPALRLAARTFHAAWCPVFDPEPVVTRIKASRVAVRETAAKEREAAKEKRRDERARRAEQVSGTSPSLEDWKKSLSEKKRTLQRILERNIELDASIETWEAIARGETIQCQGCSRAIGRDHPAEWFREQHGAAAADLSPADRALRFVLALQVQARFAPAVENSLCLNCSPIGLRQTCNRCGTRLLLAETEAMVDSVLSVAAGGLPTPTDVSGLFERYLAEAVGGLCTTCEANSSA